MDWKALHNDQSICPILLTYAEMLAGELEHMYYEWEGAPEKLKNKNQMQIDRLVAKLSGTASRSMLETRLQFVILQIGRVVVSKWFEDANLFRQATALDSSVDLADLQAVADQSSRDAYSLLDAKLPNRAEPSFQAVVEGLAKKECAGRAAEDVLYALSCLFSEEFELSDPGCDPVNEVMDAAIRAASGGGGGYLDDFNKAQERLMLCLPIIEAAISLTPD